MAYRKSATYVSERPNSALAITVTSLPLDQLLNLKEIMFEYFETALCCARWMFLPQMRILQALNIMLSVNLSARQGVQAIGFSIDNKRCMWLDVAIGIVRGLGLHKLDDPVSQLLLDDPAMPRHLPVYAQELPRRIFACMLSMDTFRTCAHRPPGDLEPGVFALTDGAFSSPFPGNYTDEQLLSPTMIRPRSDNDLTEFSFELHTNHVGRHWRRLQLKLNQADHDTVMMYDKDLRLNHFDLLTMKATHDLNEDQNAAYLMVNTVGEWRYC